NSDELKKFEEELEASDVNDVMKLIEGSTGESLEQMQDEINFFLEEKDESKEEHKDTSNPFVALFGGYDKKEKPAEKGTKPEKKEKWWPEKESYIESTHLRPFTEEKAKEMTFKVFDVYKKAHGMPSYT
ncbi:MAG: hypothetical protein NTW17_00265, partial [Candidatus Pacearchaeota archaeon]|nr:hypothetical protein [Candidatus Pacearchaeota archaeon]